MPDASVTPYSMPLAMPEYPPPPYLLGPLKGANLLCALPSQQLASLVPEPLVANSDGLLWIYLVHILAANPLPMDYHEVGIFVPVSCEGQQGLFSLALFLDQSLPITVGREVWGFPKRYADSISIDHENNRCSSKLAHEGSTLFESAFQLTESNPQTLKEQNTLVYTHRIIPSWQPGEPSINQMVALNWTSTNETRREATQAEMHVTFPAASQLSELNNMRCIKCWYSETHSCTLSGGKIVRNFLS